MKLGIRVSKSNPHFIPDLGAGTCQVNKIGYHFHETGYLFSSEAAAAAAAAAAAITTTTLKGKRSEATIFFRLLLDQEDQHSNSIP
jgi:hypothetical protein